MKTGLFDPYLDTLGGGERYLMTLAECLSKAGDQVDVFWPEKQIKKKLEKRFNLDLAGVEFRAKEAALLKISRRYDLIIFLSDGSLPFLFSRKNILHFQVPFHDVGGRSLMNQLKLKLINKVVCNSQFTKKFIDREFKLKSVVIYPPVDVASFKALKKENLILSAGRFTRTLHPKKQDVLLNEFKRLGQAHLKGWRLILAGGGRQEDNLYLKKLKKMAAGWPIEILVNVGFQELQRLYGQAKIYWHAAGLGVEEEENPEKVEHFGITTVEAMAAGCVPVVCGQGGQKEIVDHQNNGFLWQNQDQLAKYTLALVVDEKRRRKMALKAIKKSQQFSKRHFCEQWRKLIQ